MRSYTVCYTSFCFFYSASWYSIHTCSFNATDVQVLMKMTFSPKNVYYSIYEASTCLAFVDGRCAHFPIVI
jgi:hypothetical protein